MYSINRFINLVENKSYTSVIALTSMFLFVVPFSYLYLAFVVGFSPNDMCQAVWFMSKDIGTLAYDYYTGWGGRLFGLLGQGFLYSSINILESAGNALFGLGMIFFIGIYFLISASTNLPKVYLLSISIAIGCYVLTYSNIGDILIWSSANFNYLQGCSMATLSLACFLLYRNASIQCKNLLFFLSILFALFCSTSNEVSGIHLASAAFLVLVFDFIHCRKVRVTSIFYLMAIIFFVLIAILAPGNYVRKSHLDINPYGIFDLVKANTLWMMGRLEAWGTNRDFVGLIAFSAFVAIRWPQVYVVMNNRRLFISISVFIVISTLYISAFLSFYVSGGPPIERSQSLLVFYFTISVVFLTGLVFSIIGIYIKDCRLTRLAPFGAAIALVLYTISIYSSWTFTHVRNDLINGVAYNHHKQKLEWFNGLLNGINEDVEIIYTPRVMRPYGKLNEETRACVRRYINAVPFYQSR